jgi:hypothetical protein
LPKRAVGSPPRSKLTATNGVLDYSFVTVSCAVATVNGMRQCYTRDARKILNEPCLSGDGASHDSFEARIHVRSRSDT